EGAVNLGPEAPLRSVGAGHRLADPDSAGLQLGLQRLQMCAGLRHGTLRGRSMPRVEISDGGRAGTITYREGLPSASFDGEFALSPALAIITGPAARDWERVCPWARGRQAEIFEHLASEVVRQKASGCTPEIDLDAGTIPLLEPPTPPGRKP